MAATSTTDALEAGAAARTFLFLHVMKTGGTSFLSHLADNFPPGQLEPDSRVESGHLSQSAVLPYSSVQRLRDLPADRRREVRVYAGHMPFMVTELVRPDVTITLLREPVERTISFLRHCEQHEPRARHRPLEEIYEDDLWFPMMIHNYQAKLFSMTLADDLPDVAHIAALDVDDDRLASAKANLERVDVVGLHDRYEDFLAELGRRFGWRFPNAYQHRAAKGRRDVSPALRRRIAAENEPELEFYRFAVDLHRRRAAADA